ncbi:hypothetical protein H4R99_000036 [Coemansia sp. RSA 1722]|nr:hypothetical protein H4R99_000036 [Coemansia sp. RSA 1722]
MNRQHRSATVGSDEKSPPPARDLPEAVFGYGSPLARGRANRRRSTLHNILERSKKRQEEQQQQEQQQQQQDEEKQELRPSTHVSAFKNSNGIARSAKGVRRHAHQLSITDSLFTADSARQEQLSQPSQHSQQEPDTLAQSLPRETAIAPVRTVHKAELQFRRQTPPPQPRSSPIAAARQMNRSSPMHRRAEQHLRLKTASRGSRESMEKGSASRESIDRFSVMQPRTLTHKRGDSNPFRIERTYRTNERAKDSDDDDDGHSDKEADTPSASPVVPVFSLPAVQTPPAPKDLPPLPAKLQKQLNQLPRLSPPRKLVLANNPNLQLGLPEPGLPISPAAMSQSSSRRVISGSSLLRSPSKASFTDNPPSQNMHVLGPNPPASAKIGKGQASEVFRRVGYWLYSTAPVQFIKHAMVEERLDSVNVLYSTERSIWILGVSYRLKKNTKNVILPAAIEADNSHLQVDSSLFLSHHHQKRSASPSSTHHLRKPDIISQRRSEDISSRRRANTSGVMLNKKKLQSISQLQNYPAMPTISDSASQAGTTGKLGMRKLASIPSQDFIKSKMVLATPISPMPFPDDPAEDSSRFGLDTDYDVDIESDAAAAAAASGKKSTALQQPHLQPLQERPKSSKMNRLRSWVARTTNPIRRKSDVVIDVLASPMNPAHQTAKESGLMTATGCALPYVSSTRPTSPQPQTQHQPNRPSLEGYRSSGQISSARDTVRSTGAISNGAIIGSGSDPRGLGIGPSVPATRLRRKSKETMSTMSGSHKSGVDGQRRSWVNMEGNVQSMPPMPTLSDPLAPLASAGIPHDRMAHAKLNTSLLSAAQQQRRPMSSHSSVSQRIASSGGMANSVNGSTTFGPSRREANVRALVSDFAVWESPSASIMMFQREWKLPSFQQLVTIQAASSWAKSCGWAVTLSSETFFMAYIFYKLPKDVSATQNHAPGEKIVGDRLLLRMRLAMEDIESKAMAGETWRDAITAIILTIDARVAPKCPVVGTKRNMSMGSAEISESSEVQDEMTPEDHVRRMKMLEKHLAKVTESFSTHFWPRQEDYMPIFNTFPRRRTDETSGGTVIERKTIRRAHGWSMIPTLLSFRSDDAEQLETQILPPESPASSSYTRKRHLYPTGLSIVGSPPGSNNGAAIGEHHGTSIASSHDLSTIDSANGTPACHSRTPSQPPSPRSPPLSAMVVSPVSKRSSAQSHGTSKPSARPASPVHKRGTLGISSYSNDVSSLSEDFGQSLSMLPRPPLQSASSQSSGASSGFNVNMNVAACSSLSVTAAGSASGLGIRHPGSVASSVGLGIGVGTGGRQRKRKAGEAGVVGKTKGGFEVVWSATDAMSTSYVMVPVPKAATPESPTKMLKQNHSRFNIPSDTDTVGTQSQPNLKRVLESITREINLDSSYVLLLPPPPPIELGPEEDDDDEFGYLATTLLRRVKSEIVMRRTLQEFEHEYGLDLVDDDDGNDSDSFQMINGSEGGSGNNSVYFSAEDDSLLEPDTWYKRLSSSSSQHHLPSLHRLQQHPNAQVTESALRRPQPLSLNQLTLLEFFMDGMRRFYFTYRKGFPTITPSFYTSDMGWGCTYRTCQMMLAESFARVLLGRFWDPFRLSASERIRHGRIIEWFHDSDSSKAFYSIHRMARTATAMDKRIGDWLGPSIAAHVMKRLSNQHSNCPLTIHVAIDQTVYASEVRKQGLSHFEEGAEQPSWRPLLLLVPVRLGLSRLNLGYIPKIKTLFQIPQSVGLVGGKPSRSFYFIGRQGDSLFYLDPHVTRQHVPSSGTLEGQHAVHGDTDGNESTDSDASSDFEMLGIAETEEYHTTHISTMPIHRLDPSMLLGFLFNTESEWDTFVMAATDKESQRSICTGASPLFTLLSGSSMMTPQFETLVQPIPGHVTKVSAIPSALNTAGRKSPRVNSDSVLKSPRQPQTPAMSPLAAPPPPLHRMRSASSPRFDSADIKGANGPGDLEGEDDEFEML